MKYIQLAIMAALVFGGIIPAYAVPGDELLKIVNPAPDDDVRFGISVATTSNGNLLVGAPPNVNTSDGANASGYVYLFDENDGSLLLTINNPDRVSNSHFGNSVATTSNGNLLIGGSTVYLIEGLMSAPTLEEYQSNAQIDRVPMVSEYACNLGQQPSDECFKRE